ncbi:hypothetical protein H6771_00125 [Candidatus Peribacteria bacterium]|nr:hypothetical protein [Candidatus Peribacteria bacterium]
MAFIPRHRLLLFSAAGVSALVLTLVFSSHSQPSESLQASVVDVTPMGEIPTEEATPVPAPEGIQAVYHPADNLLEVVFTAEKDYEYPTMGARVSVAPGTRTTLQGYTDALRTGLRFSLPVLEEDIAAQLHTALRFGDDYDPVLFSRPIAVEIPLETRAEQVGVFTSTEDALTGDLSSRCSATGASDMPETLFPVVGGTVRFYSCVGDTYYVVRGESALLETDENLLLWLDAAMGVTPPAATDQNNTENSTESGTAAEETPTLQWQDRRGTATVDFTAESPSDSLALQPYLPMASYQLFIVQGGALHEYLQQPESTELLTRGTEDDYAVGTLPEGFADITELLLYRQPLTQEATQDVRSYLSWRHGIALESAPTLRGQAITLPEDYGHDALLLVAENEYHYQAPAAENSLLQVVAEEPVRSPSALQLSRNDAGDWAVTGHSKSLQVTLSFPMTDGQTPQLLVSLDPLFSEGITQYAPAQQPGQSRELVYSHVALMPGQYLRLGYALPALRITSTDGTEGRENVTFTLQRVGPATGAVHLTYRTTMAGESIEASVVIPTDESRVVISVPQSDNTTQDGDTLVTLELLTLEQATASTMTATATLHDDETPGVRVQVLDRNTSENGDTATVSFALQSVPQGVVQLPVKIEDPTEGSISVKQVVISPENWNSPERNTLTITGVDDAIADGDTEYVLLVGGVMSTDQAYNALTEKDIPSRITLLNTDNDTPPEAAEMINTAPEAAAEAVPSLEETAELSPTVAEQSPVRNRSLEYMQLQGLRTLRR